MASTTAGGLKTYIEGLGLGIVAYRDKAADNAIYPHVVIHEAIVVIPDADGDDGDTSSSHTLGETVQVSLWQRRGSEVFTLPDALVRALRGARLPAAPTRVYGCRVISRTRVPDVDATLIHDALTLTVRRVG